MVVREQLKTGRSVYERLRDENQDNPGSFSQSYYGVRSTYGEDFDSIDNFARAMNQLNGDPYSTVAFSTLIHPSNLIGYMAQNKQGKAASFINPAVIRDNPSLALDRLNTETAIFSERFYHVAKEGLARSAVKNIIILPLNEGVEDEEALITDIRASMGRTVKFMPSSLILKSLQKGYRGLKRADLIPGVEYFNYDEFIAAAKNDTSLVLNIPHPEDPTLYLHTSGTSGEPKIVPKSDDIFTASHNAYMSIGGLDLGNDDRSGSFYPLFPTTMMQWAVSTWVEGVEQVENPMAAFNGRSAQYIHDQRITMATLNTQAYRTFLTTPLEDGSMPFFWLPAGGGEPFELRTAQELNQRFQSLGMPNNLVLAYGFSEGNPGTHFSINSFANYDPKRANMVGKGIGRVESRIVGPDGKELPRGQRGFIEVKPDSKPLPYLGREDEWYEKWLEDGHYKTGDVGIMYEDDWLDVHGRHKDRFTGSDGQEHYLFDVNRVVNENPNILRAVPVELDNSVGDKSGKIVTYVQLKPDRKDERETTLRDLVAQVETDLEPGARPLAYGFVRDFPIDDSTKTDLRALVRQRSSLHTIEGDELIGVSFDENCEMTKKPVKKIRLLTKF
jgi:acyl-coenzyme A synthetase/AMP-(fatty) acid ligase